ncbi:MAG: efflux RND transporter periplasmic adaptor subunit [Candidatus Cloacimonetes bacterium]|nr:efflux RND transporter periplasmic adaptor subunit [Candidatus Cloacimonadota bacterium]
MKKIVIILMIILLSSCKLKDLFQKEKENNDTINKSYDITVPVTVSLSQKTALIKHIKTNGRAEAISKVEIIAESSGKIERINFLENESVKTDSVILEIDKKTILLDIQQANINLNKAKAEYKAWQDLNEQTTDEQLKLQTGFFEKELILQKLYHNLDKASIKAPFSGIISDFTLVKGEYVNQGQKLLSIINNEDILIRVNILESEISRINKNSAVTIVFPAIENEIFKGKIKSISPQIDKKSHTCEIIIEMHNTGKIKDGMYAEVKIDTEIFADRIIVYKDAMLVRDGKKLIFAVENDRAKWQYVKTGEENEYFIEITEGVDENDLIVINGNFSLSHDAEVKIVKEIPYLKLAEKF